MAAACPRGDLDVLPVWFRRRTDKRRKRMLTTNAIEGTPPRAPHVRIDGSRRPLFAWALQMQYPPTGYRRGRAPGETPC